MITTGEIGNIMFRDCVKAFPGIEVVKYHNIMEGEIKAERIAIIVKPTNSTTYWQETSIEVNLCVPKLPNGEAHTTRLTELESAAIALLGGDGRKISGEWSNEFYSYLIERRSYEEDKDMGVFFVNLHIIFKQLNTN